MATVLLYKPLPSYNAEHFWPIWALWARVIVKAVCDYANFREAKTLKGKREFVKVSSWIFGGEETGFLEVCEVVGWQPKMVRDRARAMTKDEVRKIEHRDRDPVLFLKGTASNGKSR